MDGGFEPGRLYEATYRATGRRVAGVGFAAIRDAATAVRTRTDLPVTGSRVCFGVSQSGRFLRDFLHEGFNADNAVARCSTRCGRTLPVPGGSFNERFARRGDLRRSRRRVPVRGSEPAGCQGVHDGLL